MVEQDLLPASSASGNARILHIAVAEQPGCTSLSFATLLDHGTQHAQAAMQKAIKEGSLDCVARF